MKLNKIFTPPQIIDNIRMRQKLILIYFILIILPLSFFTLLTYSRINATMQQQTLNSGTQVFEEAYKILNNDFESMCNVTKVITTGETVYDSILETYSSRDIIDELKDKTDLNNLFLYLKSNTNILNLQLYTYGEKLLLDANGQPISVKYIKSTSWYKAFIQGRNNSMWLDPVDFPDNSVNETGTFSYLQNIYNPSKFTQKIAILKVDLDGVKIDKIIKNTLITPNCVSYILNGDTLIRSTLSFDIVEKIKLNTEQLSTLRSKGWNKIDLGDNQAFVNVKQLTPNDWYFVTVMPAKDVAATGNKLRNEMLMSMIFISIAAFILAFYISASIIKRLSLLSYEMKKVESGSTDISLVKKGNDEIGELMEDFNYMISKINTLADEKYKLGIDIKSSELKALQAQINPHFLYNTLDMINCTALKNNIPEIGRQVTALAKFYRLSLNRGSDIVSLGDELEHVKTFVQIQNMRFDGKINFSITGSEDLYNYKTLKIILQPIVENSIIHGIFEKDDPFGTITIAVIKESNDIFITVEDDGIGIEKEKLEKLLDCDLSITTSGYGIKNINQRLRLYYGQEYGLTYSSSLGIGTKVTVRIPALYI